MVGLGFTELLVLLIVGLLILSVVGGAVLVVSFAVRGKASPAWSPPKPMGPATPLTAVAPGTPPLSPHARWVNDELEVTADKACTVQLFHVPLAGQEKCVLLYRFRIRPETLQGPVYGEFWVDLPDRGKFFARGLDQKVSIAPDWRVIDIPFYLEAGQRPTQLELNVVFDGAGVVRIKDIEILSAPL